MAYRRRKTSLRFRDKTVSYQEASTDESEQEQSTEQSPPVESRIRKSTARSRLQRIPDYHEGSTCSEESSDNDEIDAVPTPPPPKKARLSARTKTPRSVETSQRKSPKKVARPTTSKHNSSSKSKSTSSSIPIESDGVIRSLLELPPSILDTIFEYASYPLRNHINGANSRTNYQWLVNSALTCKGIAETALKVLYESPPLVNLNQPHALLSLLKRDQGDYFMDYASKIRSLELDGMSTLYYSLPNHGHIDLNELIRHTPRLRDLIITDPADTPPYRRLQQVRWRFPDSLFRTLCENGIRLKSWHWTKHLNKDVLDLSGIHQTDSLKTLKSLSFAHFYFRQPGHDETKVKQNEAPVYPWTILDPLQELRSLSFFHCGCQDWNWMPDHVPRQLTHLTFDCAFELYSSDLISILEKHGKSLKVLTLSSNPCLDITFLKELKRLCPVLERLSMNFYHPGSYLMYGYKGRGYDSLMQSEDVPTWPASLEQLEMLNMRHWKTDAAETFFGSLIQSAETLPYLRELTIKANLSNGWRDRAGFRDTWIRRLRKVFLRVPQETNRHLASYRENRLHHERLSSTAAQEAEPADDDNGEFPSSQESKTENSRRSRRIKAHLEDEASKRQAELTKCESDLEILERSDWKIPDTNYVQGLCNIVDVVIDNQRPSEIQFKEDDFMDSEQSGDEDWEGDFERPESTRHAW